MNEEEVKIILGRARTALNFAAGGCFHGARVLLGYKGIVVEG